MKQRRDDGPGNNLSSQGWILIALVALCSLATAGAVKWYYNRQLATMEDAVVRELKAVSESKAAQIENWRKERIGDGHVMLSSPLMRIAERVLSGRQSASDTDILTEVFTRFEESFLYSGAALTDLAGRAHLSTSGSNTDPNRLRELAAEAIAAGDAALSDLRLDSRTSRPFMAMVVPVGHDGAIVLDIDPERFLYPYLRTWTGYSQTAETLLIRREGIYALYLNDLRYHPDAPLRFRRDISGLGIPSDAALETGPLFRSTDYRGKPVLAILRHLPNSPWFLTVKIDAAEADAPERRLGWEMALITTLIGLVGLAGAALVWRGQNARIQQQRMAWFYAVANDTPAYLWMADSEQENTFLNAPFAKFLGFTGTHLAKAWSKTVHPDDAARVREEFLDGMRTQTPYTHYFRVRRHDGEYRWVASRGAPRFAPDGSFLGFAGSLEDITDQRLAEEQLREANANLQALSDRLINAQEEERTRLARELHDDFSQQIAALSIATGNLKRQIPEDRVEARAQSDRIHQRLVQLADAVRRMSHELHPAVLQYSGLPAALRSYCAEFSVLNSLVVELRIEGDFDGLDPAKALCLFRITQEALRNVVKHAHVSKASVDLSRLESRIRLTISDSGEGMKRDPAIKGGLGLLNMRERARLAGGRLDIRSSPGGGTTITVEVPE